jgi:GT2 family glycosyltransferase
MELDKKLKISIVISTKNRFHDIIDCIGSIKTQTLLPDEIVIIDSSDTSELKLESNNIKIPIRYFHTKIGLTKARNLGAEYSTGDIIIFLDDDVILNKVYIKEIMNIFYNDLDSKVGGVTGNIIMDDIKIQNRSFRQLTNSMIMRILLAMFFLPKYRDGMFQPSGWPTFINTDKISKIEILYGANMAFRREVFNEFKSDENLHGYSYMEDDDIAYRVSRKYQNIYTPFAKLIHNVSTASRDKEHTRIKMLIENSYYLFKKNFPQTLKHKFAYWWSVVGLFMKLVLGRNKEGLKGLMDGLISIKRQKKKSELNLNSH